MLEKTLVIFKPDIAGNYQVFNIAFEEVQTFCRNNNLFIIKKRIMVPTEDLVWQHYMPDLNNLAAFGKIVRQRSHRDIDLDDEELGRKVTKENVMALTDGRVVALIIEGDNAIAKIRDLVGPTDPGVARVKSPGSLRAKYCPHSITRAVRDKKPLRNGFHASSSVEEAEREIALWFPKVLWPNLGLTLALGIKTQS